MWEDRHPWSMSKDWRQARTVLPEPSSYVGCELPVVHEGWSSSSPEVKGGNVCRGQAFSHVVQEESLNSGWFGESFPNCGPTPLAEMNEGAYNVTHATVQVIYLGDTSIWSQSIDEGKYCSDFRLDVSIGSFWPRVGVRNLPQ